MKWAAAALTAALSSTAVAQTNPYQVPTGVESMPTEATRKTWSLFPGIYRSYDARTYGAEVTLLQHGKGIDFGIEDGHVRYFEFELAFWLFAIATGPRWPDHGSVGWQMTWAFPVLPVFPYGRWTSDPLHRSEYGFMIKIPLLGIDEWFR